MKKTHAQQVTEALTNAGINWETGAAKVNQMAFGYGARSRRLSAESWLHVFQDGSCISTSGDSWKVSNRCGCWFDCDCRNNRGAES